MKNTIKHLGIITDGNGRWAKNRNLPRVAGHLEGLKNIKIICKDVISLNIEVLSLYIFSTENFKREAKEVNYLMGLIKTKMISELPYFHKNNIKLLVRGDLSILEPKVRKSLEKAVNSTKDNNALTLVLCIGYGGRDEIVRTCNTLVEKNLPITEENISNYLDNFNLPFCDLIIRTGNRKRISNFLLWESAYSEIYFSDSLWPSFTKDDLMIALGCYNNTERTYGGLNEQKLS